MSASTRNLEAYGVEEGVCRAVRACAGHGGAEESVDGSASARQCADEVRLCLGACETPRDRSRDGTSFICDSQACGSATAGRPRPVAADARI